jgi:hypothetical protein
MICIAAGSQTTDRIIDDVRSKHVGRCFSDFAEIPGHEHACNLAFVGYSVWRREGSGDANSSDQQVFVIGDGQVRSLSPRHDLRNHSPYGFSWGYSGSGPAQLSLAMLMEILQDWIRVQRIYQTFKERLIAQIPQHVNWTADGADVYALVLQIEREMK